MSLSDLQHQDYPGWNCRSRLLAKLWDGQTGRSAQGIIMGFDSDDHRLRPFLRKEVSSSVNSRL